MTPTKRVRRKPEVAEQEILDAAEGLLEEVQFRDLTVDAVMAKTGMRRSNFYTYFDDRNALVMRLVDRIAGEMFAATAPWTDGEDDDRPAALRHALRATVQIWNEHAVILSAMNEAAYHDEAAQRYFRDGIMQEYIDRIAMMLRREKRAGLTQIRNPAEIARALILLNVNYLTERLPDDGARPASIAAILEDVWLGAIYPDTLR